MKVGWLPSTICLITCTLYRNCAGEAYKAVEVPEAVIDVLTSVRDYLQDKCEPPVYVSDRRFMKSVNMLQVAAYADGRDQVRGLMAGACMLRFSATFALNNSHVCI